MKRKWSLTHSRFSVVTHMITSWVCDLMCSFLKAGMRGDISSCPSSLAMIQKELLWLAIYHTLVSFIF